MINFATPVTAGTVLVRSAIQSPNYVAGTSGWTVNQDGTAEFSSGVFRGTVTGSTFQGTNFVINSAGAFFYNGTPGAGNLIASIAAAAGTDPYGNAYSSVFNAGNQAGAHFGVDANGTVYVVNAANQNVIMLNPGKQAMFVYSGTPAHGNLIVSIAATAGTDAVGNTYPQGLQVTAGTISGATISASTILGTNSIQNAAGDFYYSGTPAAGNLVASMTGAAGTDSFGNHYLAGFTTYNNPGASYSNTFGAVATYGPIVSGVPQAPPIAASVYSAIGELILYSGENPPPTSATDQATLALVAGVPATGTGGLINPQVQILDQAGTSAVDGMISGTWIKGSNNGTPDTWVAASPAAGYTAPTAQYRRDTGDNLYVVGEIDQTTGVGAAGAAVVTAAAATQYRPKVAYRIPCAWLSSGSVAKGSAVLQINTNGTWSLIWPAATANGDKFQFSAIVPLGNIG